VLAVGHQFGAAGMANSEGWLQAGELGLALLLSAIIGLEREMRQKSAGLRTYTLVGVGSALFMLISKYGFSDTASASSAPGSSSSAVTRCAA
jgi:putative Mg2+ transporter-C (MgtC) family protein